jgi:hypothetical protein
MTTGFRFNPLTGNFDLVTTSIALATDVTGVLDETNGGTAQSTYSTGDILYASGANTLAKLGAGSNGEVLTLVSGVPSWEPPSAASSNTAEYAYNTSNGYGSTYTAIRKFSQLITNNDSSGLLTVSNSATNGFTVTAVRDCWIHFNYTENANQSMFFGIMKNDTVRTTDMAAITKNSKVMCRSATPANDVPSATSVWTKAVAGDVFYAHAGGTGYGAGATPSNVWLYVFAQEI